MAETNVNIYEAKTHLSRLLEQVAQGGEIVICKAGKPVARLVSYAPQPRPPRKMGGLKGKIWVAPDFDEFSQDLQNLFSGEE